MISSSTHIWSFNLRMNRGYSDQREKAEKAEKAALVLNWNWNSVAVEFLRARAKCVTASKTAKTSLRSYLLTLQWNNEAGHPSLSLNETEDEHFSAAAWLLTLIVFSHWTWRAARCLWPLHSFAVPCFLMARTDKRIIVIGQHRACVPIPQTRGSHDWFSFQVGTHTHGSSATPPSAYFNSHCFFTEWQIHSWTKKESLRCFNNLLSIQRSHSPSLCVCRGIQTKSLKSISTCKPGTLFYSLYLRGSALWIIVC